jgi:nucleoid DNA-binding protein
LNGDAQDSLEIKLSSALLEKIFKTLAKQIHHHHVIGLIVFGLFITNKVKVRYAC